ncbi:hypothetical protein GCM10011408_21200 [Dyella caseinilytica]|nr:hypothetical protein GCM10011408_21200 [Dyella caseinilytica]
MEIDVSRRTRWRGEMSEKKFCPTCDEEIPEGSEYCYCDEEWFFEAGFGSQTHDAPP